MSGISGSGGSLPPAKGRSAGRGKSDNGQISAVVKRRAVTGRRRLGSRPGRFLAGRAGPAQATGKLSRRGPTAVKS